MGFNQTLLKGCLFVIPFLIGISISDRVVSPDILKTNADANIAAAVDDSDLGDLSTPPLDPFQGVRLAIHRNGEAEPCGHTVKSMTTAMPAEKLAGMSKYEFDHMLTASLGNFALSLSSCGPESPPPEIKGRKRKTWGRGEDYSIPGIDSSFLTFCYMGEERTPILPDHLKLIPVETNGIETLPCHFHTREGLRLTSYSQLVNFVNEAKKDTEQECSISDEGSTVCAAKETDVHLYAVPAGRQFVFAPSFIGEEFHIKHVPSEKPIYLKVMSLSPRVFDIVNFYNKEESKSIVEKALAETSESHRIKRSSTGASGYNLNSQRTSENGFDTHGKTAIIVKKRCMKVLVFDEYVESLTDGLQVLRYNKTTAYIPHMDWIDDPQKREVHDYDSARQGTNRFGTILLYMTDLEKGAGGETLFKHAWPLDVPEDKRQTRSQALELLRESGDADFLKPNSWEELMVADCRSRLAVRPTSSRAVLFYSQHPNGEEDTSSLHGGCPVLQGEKWAANLWVWNGPRGGFPGSPKNKGMEEEVDENTGKIHATFLNSGKDPKFSNAKLYYEDQYWGDFGHGDAPLSVNTFEGHKWNIKGSDGKILKTIVIKNDRTKQRHVV